MKMDLTNAEGSALKSEISPVYGHIGIKVRCFINVAFSSTILSQINNLLEESTFYHCGVGEIPQCTEEVRFHFPYF
jgi:hypothetical protein